MRSTLQLHEPQLNKTAHLESTAEDCALSSNHNQTKSIIKMVSFVTDYIQNTAASYLKTGITAAGTMAGNAVGGVGGLIENGGNAVASGTKG